MTRRVFNNELLIDTLRRDKATLLGEYTKISINSKISYICNCGINATKQFRLIVENGGAKCKDCTEIARKNKIVETNIEKFGVKCPLSSEEIKNKSKTTNLKKLGVEYPTQSKDVLEKRVISYREKYGVDSPLQSLEIKEKVKNTNLEKYGVNSPLQLLEIKEKIKLTNLEKYGTENPFASDEIKEKIKNTNIKKYGVEYVSQSKEIQNQIQQTNLARRGVKYPGQSEEVKEKAKKTNLNKYGVENPFASDKIKEKIKNTNLDKYGTEYPSQNRDVMERTQKNAKKYKEFTFPSGIIRKVQGYEPFALTELLKIYSEDQIKTERKDVPRIQYEVNGKKRYHFPDIFIPHEKKLIEVKSTWTYKCKTDNIHLKKVASQEQGYLYEIWCFNAKGNRIEETV